MRHFINHLNTVYLSERVEDNIIETVFNTPLYLVSGVALLTSVIMKLLCVIS